MKKTWGIVVTAILLAMPLQSSFAVGGVDFGARAGYGFNPDQFVVGGQAVFGAPFKNARYALSLDAGFGDNITTYLFNVDLRLIDITFPGSATGFYLGGGPAIAILDLDNFGSDTEIGLNFVAGLNLPLGSANAYNLEARIGLADMPDLRILLGIMLGGHK